MPTARPCGGRGATSSLGGGVHAQEQLRGAKELRRAAQADAHNLTNAMTGGAGEHTPRLPGGRRPCFHPAVDWVTLR